MQFNLFYIGLLCCSPAISTVFSSTPRGGRSNDNEIPSTNNRDSFNANGDFDNIKLRSGTILPMDPGFAEGEEGEITATTDMDHTSGRRIKNNAQRRKQSRYEVRENIVDGTDATNQPDELTSAEMSPIPNSTTSNSRVTLNRSDGEPDGDARTKITADIASAVKAAPAAQIDDVVAFAVVRKVEQQIGMWEKIETILKADLRKLEFGALQSNYDYSWISKALTLPKHKDIRGFLSHGFEVSNLFLFPDIRRNSPTMPNDESWVKKIENTKVKAVGTWAKFKYKIRFLEYLHEQLGFMQQFYESFIDAAYAETFHVQAYMDEIINVLIKSCKKFYTDAEDTVPQSENRKMVAILIALQNRKPLMQPNDISFNVEPILNIVNILLDVLARLQLPWVKKIDSRMKSRFHFNMKKTRDRGVVHFVTTVHVILEAVRDSQMAGHFQQFKVVEDESEKYEAVRIAVVDYTRRILPDIKLRSELINKHAYLRSMFSILLFSDTIYSLEKKHPGLRDRFIDISKTPGGLAQAWQNGADSLLAELAQSQPNGKLVRYPEMDSEPDFLVRSMNIFRHETRGLENLYGWHRDHMKNQRSTIETYPTEWVKTAHTFEHLTANVGNSEQDIFTARGSVMHFLVVVGGEDVTEKVMKKIKDKKYHQKLNELGRWFKDFGDGYTMQILSPHFTKNYDVRIFMDKRDILSEIVMTILRMLFKELSEEIVSTGNGIGKRELNFLEDKILTETRDVSYPNEDVHVAILQSVRQKHLQTAAHHTYRPRYFRPLENLFKALFFLVWLSVVIF